MTARETETRVGVIGDAIGAYWWPIGEEWRRPIMREHDSRAIVDLPRLHDYGSSRPQRLRALLDEIVAMDGDSSNGIHLSDDTLVYVRRITHDGATTTERSRAFPLAMFPSARDYMEEVQSQHAAEQRERAIQPSAAEYAEALADGVPLEHAFAASADAPRVCAICGALDLDSEHSMEGSDR